MIVVLMTAAEDYAAERANPVGLLQKSGFGTVHPTPNRILDRPVPQQEVGKIALVLPMKPNFLCS